MKKLLLVLLLIAGCSGESGTGDDVRFAYSECWKTTYGPWQSRSACIASLDDDMEACDSCCIIGFGVVEPGMYEDCADWCGFQYGQQAPVCDGYGD